MINDQPMDVYIFRDRINLSFIKINPGDWVVLKPNFVKEGKENDLNEWQCVVTSPDIIKLVCDYVCENLEGKGRITICDAPQTDSSFSEIVKRTNLLNIAAVYENKYGIPIDVVDLRNEEWKNTDGIIAERRKLKGDPEGAIAFNLGRRSLFYNHKGTGKYYGADYDEVSTNTHHRGETHEYLISASPILADVFINLPKLKTHKKTGVTLNLKNLVGINADKNWLPHYTEGSPLENGDQYPDLNLKRKLERAAVKFARNISVKVPYAGPKIAANLRKAGTAAFGSTQKVIRSGNWYMNDTTWRMALDLNRCLLYGNPDGTFREKEKKRYYSVVDGIIGMEGDGPMQGESVFSKIILGGTDPVAVDIVAARVMGFDWRKIPIICEALKLNELPITDVNPEDINVISEIPEWNGKYTEIEDTEFLGFKPHFGWIGHIEYERKKG